MLLTKTSGKKTEALKCLRCGGRMIFEKFYDVNNIFFGWHCIFCGEALDPIILLHRLSKKADLKIPEGEENIMLLLRVMGDVDSYSALRLARSSSFL